MSSDLMGDLTGRAMSVNTTNKVTERVCEINK